MNTVIKVEGLGKCYSISHEEQERYIALRDVIARKAKSIFSFNGVKNKDVNTLLKEEFWALKEINFEVHQGNRIGIIGRNGAGKSTLLKILSRITEPTTGTVKIKGRIASLLEVGTGFHPELTGRENIFLNGAILGMRRAEVRRKFDEIVDFADVEKFLDTPVKRYSSGMYVRLAFAVAAHLEPEILLIDEVLAVGDAEFQKKCLGKMEDVSKNEGRTILFVSHNMAAVQKLCDSVLLLSGGTLLNQGITEFVINEYLKEDNVSTINLEYDQNRRGNKKVIFIKLQIENLNKESVIKSGDTIALIFKLKANERDIKQVNIGFSIHNTLGDTLAVLYSSYLGQYFQFKYEGYYEIKCTIKNINLNEGLYIIKGRIEENRNESDWPSVPLGKLQIITGDFYNTGIKMPYNHVPYLINGEWDNKNPNYE